MKSQGALRAVIALVGICLAACSEPRTPSVQGVVLKPGQSVEATNKFGSVKISYVSPLKREFKLDGQARTVELIARPSPFLGERGLYDPAGCLVIGMPLCETPRLVVEEATHDFDSYDQAYAFLHQGSAVMDWVYTSDGLVVGLGREPGRDQVNVEVRQLTIHGQKPVGLRGARNGNIRLATS